MKLSSKWSKWYVLALGAAALLFAAGIGFAVLPVRAEASPHTEISAVKFPEAAPTVTPLSVTPDNESAFIHSHYEILQQDFATPQDVTKACLTCHITAANEIMHTTHWTWEYVNEATGQTLGKKHELNNFCIATSSNEPRCTSCHAGYGWKDNNFDFSAQENVDCLVCHDTTGTYKKSDAGAGMPAGYTGNPKFDENPVNLAYVAQNVGKPSRTNCLTCHAYGGGGDEVKHGDIDSSLMQPDHALDVHMDAGGLNFACTECHTTVNHQVSGSRYKHDENVKSCEDCHTATPHKKELLNTHAETLACQSCHIPEFARGGIATKMYWDWSTAGQFDANGKAIATEEYNTLKGNFIWEENVVPEYVWSNGTVEYTLAGEPIDPNQVVSINHFMGDINDPNAKIWPVKHFTGKQVYDAGNNTLAVPHLFGKDDTAYWTNFDWDKAVAVGMKSVGLPYSGEYGFVKTEFFWPITHMVAPASEAVQCQECHEPGGRIDFAALGYSEERAKALTWEPAEYSSPSTSQSNLNELVSQPVQSNDWLKWLIGIIAIGGVFEVVIAHRLED